MLLIGELSLWIALLMTAWCALVSFLGVGLGRSDLVASGRRAAYVTFAALVVASTGLWSALITHDFSLSYVASYTAANLPPLYSFAAFWSGPAGSILFCALILAKYSAISVFLNRHRGGALMPWMAGTVAMLLVVFVLAACLRSSPYARLEIAPPEGNGINPALQAAGMALYPPIMYAGYLASAIPFAFAVAALATARLDRDWPRLVQLWALLAWLLLTIGLVVGMWRAYLEPGWAGSWVRDPVKNGSLLPWLAQTAFLTAIVSQKERGVPRRWSVALAMVIFLLSMCGVMITRGFPSATVSGIAESPTGAWAATLLILGTVMTLYLVPTRLANVEAESETGRSPAGGWHRGAGFVACAGFILFVVGVAGSAFSATHDVRLKTGEEFVVSDPFGHNWRFISQGASRYAVANRQILSTTVEAWRDSQPQGLITSEQRQSMDTRERAMFAPTVAAGIRSMPMEDAYVVATAVDDNSAQLSIAFHPLVSWVWIGGMLLAAGGAALMWMRAERVQE